MKTPLIVGNWKMYHTLSESLALVKSIHYGLNYPSNIDIVVTPSFTSLDAVAQFLGKSFIDLGAQNIYFEELGAYTGEISAAQLKNIGANYVIIGHSERRQYFNETDETINKKIKAAIAHKLTPIVCIGETLEQIESNQTETIINQQLDNGFVDLSENDINTLVIAYEPIGTIGTEKTETPEQAEELHGMIRQKMTKQFNQKTANELRILYGGSITPENSKAFLSQPNIDGALIGDASLNASDFIAIIHSCF